MKQLNRQSDKQLLLSSRRAFTVVELLVVIGIIAIVLTISIALIGNTLQNARVNATRATIQKVNTLMQSQIEAFSRVDLTEQSTAAQTFFSASTPSTPVGDGLARIIAHKIAYQGLLPQREVDMYGLDQVAGTTGTPAVGVDSPVAAKMAELTANGTYIAANHRQETESSELLYLALTQTAQLGGTAVTTFTANETADTDDDGLLEFVDGWGNPLQFYRWPTRLIRPAPIGSTAGQSIVNASTNPAYAYVVNPSYAGTGFPSITGLDASVIFASLPQLEAGGTRGPATLRSQELLDPLARDTDDQVGAFANWLMLSGSPFTDANGNAINEARFHTPETWHMPLIVSAGPDQVLGLYMPFDSANFGHLAQPVFEDANGNGALDTGEDVNGNLILDENGLLDNLTNRNLRAGGN